jgi:hypothetical protein
VQRLLAIALLTWKAAFRFRLFLVVAALLLASVVGLPILIKDDGTARGFTQILLTYTLSTITALLGLSTLWLACGTLARDIEECQIQMVATKPVARWQIWFGKWLGIMSLNAALLGLSGLSVFILLQWRATRLPAAQQEVLRNEVLVARGAARPPDVEKEIDSAAEKILRDRIEKSPVANADLAEVRKQIKEQVKAEYQVIPPGYVRTWEVNLGLARRALQGKPLHLRVKFNAADKSPSGTFTGLFYVGVPQKTRLWQSEPMSLAPDTFHEFEVPPDLFDSDGTLTVSFRNINPVALLFTLDEGFEVLYPEGGFGFNFARGLGIIFCWMALLAALGLCAASFLSFPVAAFLAFGILIMVGASGLMANAVSEGTIGGYNAEKGTAGRTLADPVAIPAFKAILWAINLVTQFSPIDSLSTGRSLPWGTLLKAFGQIVLFLGGLLGVIGVVILHYRELATAQRTQ